MVFGVILAWVRHKDPYISLHSPHLVCVSNRQSLRQCSTLPSKHQGKILGIVQGHFLCANIWKHYLTWRKTSTNTTPIEKVPKCSSHFQEKTGSQRRNGLFGECILIHNYLSEVLPCCSTTAQPCSHRRKDGECKWIFWTTLMLCCLFSLYGQSLRLCCCSWPQRASEEALPHVQWPRPLSRARCIWLWALPPPQACWVRLSASHSGFLSQRELSAKMETAGFLYLAVGAPFISLGTFSLTSYKFCQDKTCGFLYNFLLWLTTAVAAEPAVLLVIWQPWSCWWLNRSSGRGPACAGWAVTLPTPFTSGKHQVFTVWEALGKPYTLWYKLLDCRSPLQVWMSFSMLLGSVRLLGRRYRSMGTGAAQGCSSLRAVLLKTDPQLPPAETEEKCSRNSRQWSRLPLEGT